MRPTHRKKQYRSTGSLVGTDVLACEPSQILENDQILFKYCDENGDITKDSNPNGSILNIAGICNVDRNIFGMMPHPERAADRELCNQDGRVLFESILNKVLS